jgi:cobalt ECF transporter T component CbiQ
MGIMGPAVAWLIWAICKKVRVPIQAGVFLAVSLSDLVTYITTSFQLALAFPSTGFSNAFLKFAGVFAVTQIPLAIAEGILAVFIFEFLLKYKSQILSSMKVIRSPIADAQEKPFQLKKKHYAILIAFMLTLFIIPLVFISTNMSGADDAAAELITATGYQPWFDSILTLPEEWVTVLFGVQALIGGSIIAYLILRERRKHKTQQQKHRHRHSHDEGHSNLSAQIDSYAYTNSLAKTSPTTKIVFAASMLLLSVLSGSPVVAITVFLIVASLIVAAAEISWRFYFDLLLYPLLFAIVSCIFIALFFGSGTALFELPTPWFTWTIYTSGITTAVATFFRVLGAVSAMFFLVLTTSMNDLFVSLRKIRIPKILIEISLLTYRYIFVFIEVSFKMNTAQKLRLGQQGWMKRIRSTALLASNLFIRTLEQGERTLIAMNARGYDGNIRILEDQPKPSKAAIAGIILLDIALALIAFNIINLGVI